MSKNFENQVVFHVPISTNLFCIIFISKNVLHDCSLLYELFHSSKMPRASNEADIRSMTMFLIGK